MNAASWQEIEEILDRALDLPTEEREPYLDSVCRGRPRLRERIKGLLRADEVAERDRFMSEPAPLLRDLVRPRPSSGSTPPAQADRYRQSSDGPCAVDADDTGRWILPDQVGTFRLLERIGHGGMGVVYRAEDVRLKRTVALKFFRRGYFWDDDGKARLLREAHAAAVLDHPNICTVYQVGETDRGQSFIAMAYIEGQTLRERMATGPLSWEECRQLAIQIALGLHAAHARGVVHRDIKPGNLMLTPEGRVKILDFGLARSGGDTRITLPGVRIGTVAYMSPEQARGEEVDHRTDIWSWGAVLYEMLAGHSPFRGESELAVIEGILYRELPPLATSLGDVPADLVAATRKALQKDPGKRYADLGKILEEWGVTPDSQRGLTVVMPALATRRSIAVIPFANLSADTRDTWFVDGITEEIITQLAKIRDLRVISRTSTMQFKGTTKTVREIARELRVGTVLEGSVRRIGERVRVTAQLIDAANEGHLWAETYDRPTEDVFRVQGDVALRIADTLKAQLTHEERSRVGQVRPANPEVLALYVRARQIWDRRHPGALEAAKALFEKAIHLEPDYAPAHAGLADVYGVLGYWAILPGHEAFARAKEEAQRALEIDGDLAEAHASLGWCAATHDWDWPEAEARFLRALELRPNDVTTRQWYSIYLTAVGRGDEALDEARRAADLDPCSVVASRYVGIILHTALRRHEEALACIERVRDLEPSYPIVYLFIAGGHAGAGRWNEAAEAMETYRALGGETSIGIGWTGCWLGHAGRTAEARQCLTRLDELAPRTYVPHYARAMTYIGLGELDTAMELLEKAADEHESMLTCVWNHFVVDPLRSHPRFPVLLRKMNLVEGHPRPTVTTSSAASDTPVAGESSDGPRSSLDMT